MSRLDAGLIAKAAWKIVDEKGLRAFTIRAVAEELGVSAMAIYHHVADKASLAKLMVEIANSERPLAAPSGNWRNDLLAMARWVRETRLAHPALPKLRRDFRVWTPALLKITERWITLWQQSGLPLEQALIAARASSQAVVGMVDEEAVYEGEEPPGEDIMTWTPSVRVMFEKDHDQDALFDLAVRALVDGLYLQLSSDTAQDSTAARA
jgi:AcrR family transcriptional regulator